MSFRHLKNGLSRQDDSKTKLSCSEDVLRRLGNSDLFENGVYKSLSNFGFIMSMLL